MDFDDLDTIKASLEKSRASAKALVDGSGDRNVEILADVIMDLQETILDLLTLIVLLDERILTLELGLTPVDPS